MAARGSSFRDYKRRRSVRAQQEAPPRCDDCRHSARTFDAMPQLLFCKNKHVVAGLTVLAGTSGVAENTARVHGPCGWRGELFSPKGIAK